LSKDAALNEAYRQRYFTCYRSYSLAVPFTERFLDLTIPAENGSAAGFAGMITANSFMKREFGKKLIEQFLPHFDLTHVIDTAGAFIPGHGTPTVILFSRNRQPVGGTVRGVMGIRGEPVRPVDPARGEVWGAILVQLDSPGSESAFVSVSELPRAAFGQHPWSLGGGGASALRIALQATSKKALFEEIDEIGFGAVTREDDTYILNAESIARARISDQFVRTIVTGEDVRDWRISSSSFCIFPYSEPNLDPVCAPEAERFLWPARVRLRKRVAYGESQTERGLTWFEYSMLFKHRYLRPLSIAFACVATHNHFVLGHGAKVFNRHAPVIKLRAGASEEDHLALLGFLNSSTACFWMKQVFQSRGAGGGTRVASGRSPLGDEAWESHFELTATGLNTFPLPDDLEVGVSHELDRLAQELTQMLPRQLLQSGLSSRAELDAAREQAPP
jgi:hypothetical protein